MSDTLLTERTKVRRLAARGAYDRDTINAIIDERAGTESGRITSLNPTAKSK